MQTVSHSIVNHTVPLGVVRAHRFCFLDKSSLKFICIYAADVKSRQCFQDNKIIAILHVKGYYINLLKFEFELLHNRQFCQFIKFWNYHLSLYTRPRNAVSNVSGNRCESDCRSRVCEFNPGPVPYFRGD